MKADDICAIFSVCYTGKIERRDRIDGEVKRVFGREPTTIWGFPSPYEKFLLSKIPHISELDTHPGSWGATLSHYRAIKIAHDTGLDNALIVEDDCRFLKCERSVHDALGRAPNDYDFLMLDSFYVTGQSPDADGWARFGSCNSTACYLINRRAMEVLIDMYESPVSGKYSRPMMRNSDHWTNERIIGREYKMYCACPNLAVQCRCPGTSNWGEAVFSGYVKRGIDINDYMPF